MTHKIVVIGGTSVIALWCVRLWLREEGASSVVLAGRNAERLASAAADLRVRSSASTIATKIVDFENPQRIAAEVDEMCGDGVPDIVLIAQGSLPDQQLCQRDLACVEHALRINGVSPVLFAEAFASQMENVGRGTLIVIGSVAGDRGRKKNYVYGAAKSLIDRYVQGLQHRFAKTGIRIVLVKPGPTDTPMTAQTATSKLAAPEDVARRIVARVESGAAVIYAPARWRWIMFIVRHLPRVVFDRLDI